MANGELALHYVSRMYSLDNDRNTGIIDSHVMPAGLPDHLNNEIISLVNTTVRALGLGNGPLYFQIKRTGSGARIIEATPRLDGCHLWEIIRLKYGVDLTRCRSNICWMRDQSDHAAPDRANGRAR